MSRITATVIAILICVPQSTLEAQSAGAPSSMSPEHTPQRIAREVEFSETLWCTPGEQGEGALTDVVVRISLPQSDDRQQVSNLRFLENPSGIETDVYGNRFAVFRRTSLGLQDKWTIGYSCEASIVPVGHVLDEETLLPLDRVPPEIAARYLRSDEAYGMHDEGMQEMARSLDAKSRNSLDLLRTINEYLCDRLEYRNDGRWDDAHVVLENRHGSCSEYTFSAIGLARLCGVPARYVGATALRSKDETYVDSVHHRWGEFYLPGHGWFPMDVSRNDGEEGGDRQSCFGRTAPTLLTLMKGDGGKNAPLGWGYVTRSEYAQGTPGASLRMRKRFIWHKPKDKGGKTQN